MEPCIGFSNALRIIAAVTNVKKDQIIMKRIHTFLAESKNGIDHIPIKVHSYMKRKIINFTSFQMTPLMAPRRIVPISRSVALFASCNTLLKTYVVFVGIDLSPFH